MAKGFNKVIIVGNLTRDPEVKYIASGTAVANCGVAINERRKDNTGNWVDDTTFVDVTFWGRTAEVLGEYCHKGSSILVEGKLRLEQWESEGQKRSKVSVTGLNLQMLDGKPQGGQGTGQQQGQYQQQPPVGAATGAGGEEVPF